MAADPALALSPLDPATVRDAVYEALREAFLRGAFAPGDVINLRLIAHRLGVSLTPVREAVRRLVAEGALIDTPSRTVMVPPFEPRRAADLMAARLALEALVLDQAIEQLDRPVLDQLRQILEKSTRGADDAPDLVANHTFHFTLYRLSGSEVLLRLVEALWLQYGAYLNLIVRRPEARTMDEHQYHRALVAAIAAGDRTAAHKALRADIIRSFRILIPKGRDGRAS